LAILASQRTQGVDGPTETNLPSVSDRAASHAFHHGHCIGADAEAHTVVQRLPPYGPSRYDRGIQQTEVGGFMARVVPSHAVELIDSIFPQATQKGVSGDALWIASGQSEKVAVIDSG
jgi:hypothetical protein